MRQIWLLLRSLAAARGRADVQLFFWLRATQRPPKIPIIHDSVEEILHFWAPNIRHGDTVSLEDLRDALLDRERGCRGAVWQGLQRSNLASCSEIGDRTRGASRLGNTVVACWCHMMSWCDAWQLETEIDVETLSVSSNRSFGWGIRDQVQEMIQALRWIQSFQSESRGTLVKWETHQSSILISFCWCYKKSCTHTCIWLYHLPDTCIP